MSKQVILFTSEGCGPCKVIKESFPDLERQYKVDTLVHEIDWRKDELKEKTAQFKSDLGLPQSFAMLTPGLVVREIPSGRIIASADGSPGSSNANMDWLILTLEQNPNPFDFLPNVIPDSIAIPDLFTGFGSVLVDDDILMTLGMDNIESKSEFSNIFDVNNPVPYFVAFITIIVFLVTAYKIRQLITV